MKGIPVVPTLVTLGNMFCGFAALGCVAKATSVEGNFWIDIQWAGWLILIAMVFDALDGKVARLAGMTSDFGVQLDSLSDMVSFGVAPGAIVKVVATRLEILPRVAWVTSIMFVLCAAMRLARFNVETEEDAESHQYFRGLPTPAAAGVIASLMVMYSSLLEDRVVGRIATRIEPVAEPVMMLVVKLMPLVAVLLAVLMISRLRYPHVMSRLLREKKPFGYLVCVLFLVLVAFLTKPFSLPVIFGVYALSGPLGAARSGIMARRRTVQ